MGDNDLVKTSNTVDRVLSGVKATIAAIPALGGPLSSLLGDYQSGRRIKRVTTFLEMLQKDLEGLEDNINEEFIKNDDFLDVFEETLSLISRERTEEKREAFRHILENAMVTNDATYNEVEEFLRLINRLALLHMSLLAILKDAVEYDEATGNRVGKGGGITTTISQIFRKLVPDLSEETLLDILHLLVNERLIEENIVKNFNRKMSDQGIMHLEQKITPKGARLCTFIERPSR